MQLVRIKLHFEPFGQFLYKTMWKLMQKMRYGNKLMPRMCLGIKLEHNYHNYTSKLILCKKRRFRVKFSTTKFK
jgi:hypothetical protein